MGMLFEAPEIKMPPRAKTLKFMKGRPITTEEFERMLKVTSKVVGEEFADGWKYLLCGLWESGLRRAEALDFWWDRSDKPTPRYLESANQHPVIFIPAACEKGNEDRELPITPQFAKHLLETPKSERTGKVYSPGLKRQLAKHPSSQSVGRVVTRIGKRANVKVSEKLDDKTGEATVKFASAHDLRRSFGDRLSKMPGINSRILKGLMRHKTVLTTEKFYLSDDAQEMGGVLNKAFANTIANSGQSDLKKEGLPQSS